MLFLSLADSSVFFGTGGNFIGDVHRKVSNVSVFKIGNIIFSIFSI